MKLYRKRDDGDHTPVRMNGVQPECVLGIMIATTVLNDRGYRMTLTEIVAPRQGRSFHPVGLAFDCRIWEIPVADRNDVVDELRAALGSEWDVVLKPDHIHCELDVGE